MKIYCLCLVFCFSFVLVGCSVAADPPVGAAADVATPVPAGYLDPAELATRDASELRRVRDEHAALIRSRAVPVGVTPTPPLHVAQEAAIAQVLEWGEGFPVLPDSRSFWFEPGEGVSFFRYDGGDWTRRRVREGHSHRDVIYFESFPPQVPNFFAGSVQPHLARELVFAATDVMPELGTPSPLLIRHFLRNLGWEFVVSSEPVANVWTFYQWRDDDVVQRFAVGGVMLFESRQMVVSGETYPYLVPGRWLGSVVVERLD